LTSIVLHSLYAKKDINVEAIALSFQGAPPDNIIQKCKEIEGNRGEDNGTYLIQLKCL